MSRTRGLYAPTILNILPNDKVLDVTKLKTFPDDKLNLARTIILSLIG